MKPSRILYAGLFHETHSFVPEVTRWDDFEVARGEEIRAKAGDGSPTDGFLAEAERQQWEVVPLIDARAMPGGTVEAAVLEQFWAEFEARARPELAAGVEGIFLVLHGAMVTPDCADVEGELLARIRALPGAGSLPLFGVLDLHANVSARMCELANGLVTYRENPHTDARRAAERATALLGRCLREKRVPRMAWCRPPIVWAPPGTGTHAEPMLTLKLFARKVEVSQPDVWACNVAAGFAYADTPDTGLTLSVVTTGPLGPARRQLEAGARLAWAERELGQVTYPLVDDVLRRHRERDGGPVLLVEPADNIGAGAPGDGTGVLRALLAHGVQRGLVVICDPGAVTALAAVPVGGTRRLELGGRGWRGDAGPVVADVTLRSRSDGRFTLEDPQSHLASMSGSRFDMGPCAVVQCDGVTVLLTSHRTPPFDLGQLRSQGLEPRGFDFIGVKAAVAHQRAYAPVARASYHVETPGPCPTDLRRLPWRRLRRPVWPLDEAESPQVLIS